MTELSDFAKYSIRLRTCRKIYNIITIIYAVICLCYTISQLFMVLISTNSGTLFLALDCVIFKPLEFVFGFFCCYKHKTQYAYFAVLLQLINTMLNITRTTFIDNFIKKAVPFFNTNIIILIMMIIMAVILTNTNKSYLFLEQQAGFPYFDEKFEDQKFDAIRNNIKNDYQTKMEEYQKNAPDDMAELDLNAKIPNKPEDTSTYNSMESL